MKNLSTIYDLLSTNVISWVKANRVEAMLLSIILLTGAFLRLYRIDEYMTFLGKRCYFSAKTIGAWRSNLNWTGNFNR